MMWRSDLKEVVPTSILSSERCHLGDGPTMMRLPTPLGGWISLRDGCSGLVLRAERSASELGGLASALAVH
jgi:hypothetical protein